MTDSIEAIYENGVLKPLSAVGLKENHRYRLTLQETSDTESDFSLDAAHPVLGRIIFNEDPSLPLDPEDWPDEDDTPNT